MRTIIFLIVCSILWVADSRKPGVQVRLTDKGMKYLAQIAKQTLQNELKKTTFNDHSRSGSVEFWLSETTISEANFPTVQLAPAANVGIKAVISGATVAASGKIRYKYKKFIISFSDTIGISIRINGVHIESTVALGATSKGEPTISLAGCNSNIGSVDITFHGGLKKFIYNLFRGTIERKMKDVLSGKLCGLLRKEIEESARAEFATFPVTKKIDKWAEIDYRLTTSPTFTNNYMDIFLKGEFKSVVKPKESALVVQAFDTPTLHDKMMYFWLSEYTVNTAGEVYQHTKRLDVKIEAWDKKIPEAIRKQLNTSMIKLFIPNLKKYPNLPMAVRIVSRIAPKVIMNEKSVDLFLFVDAIFSVKMKEGKEKEMFVLRIDIDTSLQVNITDKQLRGKITKFDYDASVFKSDIGKIDTTLFNSPFVKIVVEGVIISGANVQLQKGFPLPQLKHVELQNVDIQLHKNVIQIGVNIYKK